MDDLTACLGRKQVKGLDYSIGPDRLGRLPVDSGADIGGLMTLALLHDQIFLAEADGDITVAAQARSKTGAPENVEVNTGR